MEKISAPITLSVVIPVYQSAQCIDGVISRTSTALSAAKISFEIIAVNDGSTDEVANKLLLLQKQYPALHIIHFKKNRGQLEATTCGIMQSKGKVIITMDDDLQYAPEDLPQLYNCFIVSGKKLLLGTATKLHGHVSLNIYRLIARFVFNKFIMRDYAGIVYFSSLRIAFADVLKNELPHLFYIWALAPSQIGNYYTTHHPTQKKQSSYTLYKRLRQFTPFFLYATSKVSLYLLLPVIVALLAIHSKQYIFIAAVLLLALWIFSNVWLALSALFLNKRYGHETQN